MAQRIRIILLLEESCSYAEIEEQLRVPASTISRWKRRYQKDGLRGLATIHPGQAPSKLKAALRARCWIEPDKLRATGPPIGRCEKWLR